jgi:excisionase family DNA binding protein
MTDPLIPASRVAELLGLRVSTVYALCSRGELPHTILARRQRRNLIRFRRSDIESFLRDRTVEPETKA